METLFYYTVATVWLLATAALAAVLTLLLNHAAEAAVMAWKCQRALRSENAPKEKTFRLWWHLFCDPCDTFYINYRSVRWPSFWSRRRERFGRTRYRILPKSDA